MSSQLSVLYREPKLLKGAERGEKTHLFPFFQCSTVSRNC